MKAPISKIRRITEKLQELLDEAEYRGVNEVEVVCNTYGLSEFIGLGSYGYLNLNADTDELIEDPEFDDDMD